MENRPTTSNEAKAAGAVLPRLDWLFLAMAHWQLGDKGAARKWYDQAVQWMEKFAPRNDEILRFRAEAAALLQVKEPAPVNNKPKAPAPQPPTS